MRADPLPADFSRLRLFRANGVDGKTCMPPSLGRWLCTTRVLCMWIGSMIRYPYNDVLVYTYVCTFGVSHYCSRTSYYTTVRGINVDLCKEYVWDLGFVKSMVTTFDLLSEELLSLRFLIFPDKIPLGRRSVRHSVCSITTLLVASITPYIYL